MAYRSGDAQFVGAERFVPSERKKSKKDFVEANLLREIDRFFNFPNQERFHERDVSNRLTVAVVRALLACLFVVC
jgi:hypothetical protein